ncbi:MAG: T9SS type A sorting domain-containing protein [Bacteroidales bacterium]|nr:T9SS type A sorting domain-containing protein [Bacteroidales bacterium]
MTIALDSPFFYDPYQSLIVEVGQCGAPGASGASASYTNLTGNRRLWSLGGCPFNVYPYANSSVYHMGLNIVATGPVAVTNPATSVTTTTASLNGTVNARLTPTTVTFEYGLTAAYGTSVAGTPGVVTGNAATPITAGITGLLPDMTYHYRINGVNGNGTANGEDMTFVTTLPSPTISGPTPVCAGSTGNVYTTEAGYSGYIWAVSAGGSITAGGTGSDNVEVTWNTAGAQAVIVNYTNENGYAPSFTIYPVLVTSLPPQTITLENIVVARGQEQCYDANQTVTTGGAGTFLVQPMAAVDLIAGQHINMLPGTKVEQAGYLHAFVVTNCLWCSAYPVNQMVAAQPDTTNQEAMIIPFIENPPNVLFRVYPNPTTGEFTLEIDPSLAYSKTTVQIFSFLGKEVLRNEMKGMKKERFSLQDSPPGIYLVRLVCDEKTGTAKIIRK